MYAPIEVAADNEGYFTIQGLQTGKQYQLLARTLDGDRKLAGTVFATPPYPRLVIRISEDNVTPRTPEVPSAPLWPTPGPRAPTPSWPKEKTDSPPRPAGLGNPVKSDDPDPAPVRPSRPDKVISINPVVPPAPPSTDPPATPAPPSSSVTPDVPAPVPSCALTGNTLANFALNDLDGRPWEYRQHRARLTLIDFWGTWCVGCLHSIPHLKILQERYANYGLQVVGIAYEKGSLPEQVQAVNRIRQRYNISYQVLLGGETSTCPVRQQFDVHSFPTLVLVDETGRILWRSQGLDQQQISELDLLIRKRLGVR
jgi:thiol-disulfide isomerase/thioredoxin